MTPNSQSFSRLGGTSYALLPLGLLSWELSRWNVCVCVCLCIYVFMGVCVCACICM